MKLLVILLLSATCIAEYPFTKNSTEDALVQKLSTVAEQQALVEVFEKTDIGESVTQQMIQNDKVMQKLMEQDGVEKSVLANDAVMSKLINDDTLIDKILGDSESVEKLANTVADSPDRLSKFMGGGRMAKFLKSKEGKARVKALMNETMAKLQDNVDRNGGVSALIGATLNTFEETAGVKTLLSVLVFLPMILVTLHAIICITTMFCCCCPCGLTGDGSGKKSKESGSKKKKPAGSKSKGKKKSKEGNKSDEKSAQQSVQQSAVQSVAQSGKSVE